MNINFYLLLNLLFFVTLLSNISNIFRLIKTITTIIVLKRVKLVFFFITNRNTIVNYRCAVITHILLYSLPELTNFRYSLLFN